MSDGHGTDEAIRYAESANEAFVQWGDKLQFRSVTMSLDEAKQAVSFLAPGCRWVIYKTRDFPMYFGRSEEPVESEHSDLTEELAAMSDVQLTERASELPRHPDEFQPEDVRIADEIVNRWLSSWGGVKRRQ